MTLLAWTPFMMPLPGVQQQWLWLLIPLIFGIAMMYKAVRVESIEDGGYWRQVGLMTLQILGVFIGLGVGFLILVQFLVPMLPSS